MLVKLPANEINQIFEEHQNAIRYFTIFPDTILKHLLDFVVRQSKFVAGQIQVPPPIVVKHELPSDHFLSELRDRYSRYNERNVPRFNVLLAELQSLYQCCYKEIYLGFRHLIVSMGITSLPQLFEYNFRIEYVDDGYFVIQVVKSISPAHRPTYIWNSYHHGQYNRI